MSRILENVHKSAIALHEGGFIGDAQKREFERLRQQTKRHKPTSNSNKD